MSGGISPELNRAREQYQKVYAEWNSKSRNLDHMGEMLRQLKVFLKVIILNLISL